MLRNTRRATLNRIDTHKERRAIKVVLQVYLYDVRRRWTHNLRGVKESLGIRGAVVDVDEVVA